MEWIVLAIVVMFFIFLMQPSNRITFGQFKGKKFSSLPTDYLNWLVDNVSKVRRQALSELKRREKFHNDNNAIFGIIEAKRKCWKCKKKTRIITLKFYNSYGTIKIYNYPIIVYNQQSLPNDVLNIIQERFPFFKSKYSYTVEGTYIANTCEHCGALQGDFYLHEEPDGAFFDAYSLEPKYFIGLKDGKLQYINR